MTRRTFLGSVAAAPLAAGGSSASTGSTPAARAVVVGAGAFGGWTALQLLRRGARVTLLDAWGAGNSRSSSGGETRVIRAIYGPDRIYVEMVRRAYALWEELDGGQEEALYHESGALWLHRGEDAYVRASVPILESLGFPVEQLSLEEARRRYKQIDFNGIRSVWLERRAGALSARRACMAVRDRFIKEGGTYRIARALPPEEGGALRRLQLEDGSSIEADLFVFAAGPWLGRLFPAVIGGRVQPTRQEVFYFGTPAGSTRYLPANLPVWIDFGERIFYGLPDLHERGFKVADDTRGEPFDPTAGERRASAEGLARVRALLKERFPELASAPLLSSEVCQYENSPDGHLIVDRHPDLPNLWLLGGGSGHGFKLGPAVGEIASAAILEGKEVPALFQLDRLRESEKSKTQFETKRGTS